MLTYTNHLKPLILPEYGRNIQNMVDRAVEIEERDERTRCAETIVDTMLTLFPPTGDRQEYIRKLWDHVLIMSDFRLDVDLPFEPVNPAVFEDRPDPLPLPEPSDLRHHIYGKYIGHLIDIAASMPEGEERDALVMLTATQMKKVLLEENRDNVDDRTVFEDLYYMSHGNIRLDTADTTLPEFRQAPTPSGKKKKKK